MVVTDIDENSACVYVTNATPGFTHIAISYTAKNDPNDCGTKIMGTMGKIVGLKSNTEYEIKAYQVNVNVDSNHMANSTSTYLGTTSFKTAPSTPDIVVTNIDENSADVQVNNATSGFTHIVVSYTAKNDPNDCGTNIMGTTGKIEGLKSNTEYEIKVYQVNVRVDSNHMANSTSTYLGTTSFKTL